jgi:hypothetical protein
MVGCGAGTWGRVHSRIPADPPNGEIERSGWAPFIALAMLGER